MNVTNEIIHNITSPNYPNSIPITATCTWIITSTDNGHPMAEFIIARLKYRYHFVWFYDTIVKHYPIYEVYTGVTPNTIMSYTQVMMVYFMTNFAPVTGTFHFLIEVTSKPVNRK